MRMAKMKFEVIGKDFLRSTDHARTFRRLRDATSPRLHHHYQYMDKQGISSPRDVFITKYIRFIGICPITVLGSTAKHQQQTKSQATKKKLQFLHRASTIRQLKSPKANHTLPLHPSGFHTSPCPAQKPSPQPAESKRPIQELCHIDGE